VDHQVRYQQSNAAEWALEGEDDELDYPPTYSPDPSLIEPFDPEANGPGYQYMRLADYLAECIKRGAIKSNAKLTSQRKLCRQYGVSLATTRLALAELQRRGLIKTLPSKGMWVL
jgi:hypothetical protein